jgi:tetratricopeptide (TPR) repeat protein
MRRACALLVVAASACSHDKSPATSVSAAPPSASVPSARGRVDTSELRQLRGHLEFGRIEQAEALLERAREAGDEEPLLRARAAALRGRAIEAIRLVESARERNGKDPAVYATAAEIYAAAGKPDAGWDEAKKGEAACGAAPEILRAKGVLWISREGGAEKGLSLLMEARAADPDLPFADRALSQAHLLVGKKNAAARNLSAALAHARAAVAFDPEEVDARRFLSESLAGTGEFEASIAELEALSARGVDLGSELALRHKNAGIAALLEHDRARAIGHFATARKLGLTDAELSTGARLLGEESLARVDQGVAAYARGDAVAAEKLFREALDLDPDSIQARNHLAVVLFKATRYAEAARLWETVLATAIAEKIELPEPVHVNLAKALAQAGDGAGARRVLEDYLRREPQGEWVGPTKDLLERIPAPPASDGPR